MMEELDLFAGGAGFDEAVTGGFGLGDLDATPVAGGFEFLFEGRPFRLITTLTGFERVRLDDFTLNLRASVIPAPVLLPAGLPWLIGAMRGLAVLRRRRRTAPTAWSGAAIPKAEG